MTDTDSRGLLTLAAPACANSNCSVGFSVTVPSGVTVNADASGGPVTVVGTGAADIDSGGGPVYAAGIGGPLTVTADGGGVTVEQRGRRGPGLWRRAGDRDRHHRQAHRARRGRRGQPSRSAPTAAIDSGGGPVYAAGISGPLTVTAEGGGVTATGAGATQIDSGGGPVTASTIQWTAQRAAEGGGVEASGVTGALNATPAAGRCPPPASPRPPRWSAAKAAAFHWASLPRRRRCSVDTGGGDASLSVPGGPYAVTADTGGSQESVLIGTSPGAASSISVSTEGGEPADRPGVRHRPPRAPGRGTRRAPPSPHREVSGSGGADGVKHEPVRDHRIV